MILNRFFRWIYNVYFKNGYIETNEKKWKTPKCMQGITQLSRKEKATYTPSDMWSDEDHVLFLKYCPEK